jgi:anti-sigma factor (TIGR02949 family)
MNCREAAKFLYAFADGELETRDNLHVLEHINMCPECCGKVTIQQQLKGAIAVAFRDEVAPVSLHDRIRSALAAAEDASVGPSRIISLWRPLAAAAVIVLAMVGLWSFQDRTRGPAPIPLANVQFTDASQNARLLATNVYTMHRKCTLAGKDHQDKKLPKDGLAAARVLCKELNYPMLRCGKLDANPDTEFVSASFCGVADCEGALHKGGHLIYTFKSGPMRGRAISMISVTHLTELRNLNKIHMGERDYCIMEPTTASEQDPATVVAFDCPGASHLVCLEADPKATMRFVQDMQPVSAQQAEIGTHPKLLLALTNH